MPNDGLKTAKNAKSIIKKAREAKGWTCDSKIPLREASKIINADWQSNNEPYIDGIDGVSEGSWKRFLYGTEKLRANIYQAYAQILGLNWKDIVEKYDNDDLSSDPHIKVVPPENDPNFVGREEAIAQLNQLIKNSNTRICQIIASGGQGKTTLAKKYLESKFKTVLEFNIAKETKDIPPVKSLLEQKLGQLGQEPAQDFMLSLERLKQTLQTQPIGILIDNLEPALDGKGKFIEDHRSYLQLLIALSHSSLKSLTLITTREPLYEGLNIPPYHLPSLTVSAWEEFWQYQGINADITLLTEIHKAYGGNALAMQVLFYAINDGYINISDYWQDNKTEDHLTVETAVANLIKEQFERLQKNNLSAYNLLCRLGCYRYQDVPTIPKTGLKCLLWDVEKNQHNKIINLLKERRLVEFNKDREYCLHPVIREEAIERLRKSDDWKEANTKAGKFWTKSVETVETVKDAITALEAYHHYMAIYEWNKAAEIIVKTKGNDEKGIENLGYACWRLGLYDLITNLINRVIDKITDQLILSMFYRIIGYSQNLLGKIYTAIDYHKQSLQIVLNHFTEISKNTKNEIFEELPIQDMIHAYYINVGLAKFDLWELEESLSYFEKALEISQQYDDLFETSSYSCLALIKSYFKNNNANDLVDIALKSYQKKHFEAGIWVRVYSPIFMGKTYVNLGNIKQSFQMYNKALDYANQIHYIQAQANCLCGLGELYRIQNDYETALNHHRQAIEILEKIGAKCDLADAYFQRALTYQQMQEQGNAQKYFEQAITLWSAEQINAPKQIERVKTKLVT